jgi:predicted alpha/beta hydrolase family esterase
MKETKRKKSNEKLHRSGVDDLGRFRRILFSLGMTACLTCGSVSFAFPQSAGIMRPGHMILDPTLRSICSSLHKISDRPQYPFDCPADSKLLSQMDILAPSTKKSLDTINSLPEESNYAPGSYTIGTVNVSQPTLIFVPGANSPPDTFNHYMSSFKDRYNMFIFFYHYLDHLDDIAELLGNELARLNFSFQVENVVFVAHSFGNNVLMKCILDTSKRAFFQKSHIVRLTSTIAGSKKACNASNGFRQFFIGIASILPLVKDYRNVSAAQDPLGSTIESLVQGYGKFKEKVKTVHTIAIMEDSHAPSEHSPSLFKQNYRNG